MTTAGPVERWVREVFDGVPRALNNSLRFARQHDERTAALVEALEGLLTRIDAAHLENWKDRDVDWFALLRAQAALAAFKEEA